MNSILLNFRCLEIKLEIRFFMVGLIYQIGLLGLGYFNSQAIGVKILGWPKSSFGLFHSIMWKNFNELFSQPNILC